MSRGNWSYWEKSAHLNKIDVLIAGSGIVGINCAIQLKMKAPSLKVVVADRSFIPSGASTKNAGFACFGSISELLDDLSVLSEDEVFRLVEKRWRGLQALRSLLGDNAIEFSSFGGYEIFSSDQTELFEECSAKIDIFNKHLNNISGFSNVFSVRDDKISTFGFQKINHLIYNELEGQLHPGKMMDALSAYARDLGVGFWGGFTISKYSSKSKSVNVVNDKNEIVSTKNFAIATNGFANSILPDIDLKPGRGQVFLTKSIPDHKLKGVYHFDRGYVYFRDVGDRILIGGGRNIDVDEETTSDFGTTNKIEEYISTILREYVLPNHKVAFEMKWSGIMGIGKQKKTITKKVEDNVYCAVRLGGMGVAIGTLVGQELADVILHDL